MGFASDLKRFSGKTERNVSKIVKKIVIDISTRIVFRTPVGNPTLWQSDPPPGYAGGRARANWQYGNGSMPEGALDLVDASGNLTIAKIIAGVNGSKAASVHWVGNNLPYIKPLEEGWSTQAPAGMLRISVSEFESVVESVAREIK